MGGVRTGTALLMLLVLTGCADSPPSARPAATQAAAAASSSPPAPAGPSAAPDPGPAPAEPVERRCDHPTEGFSVAFPADWFVAEPDGIEPCTFFHPEPLTLPPNSEATGVAIRVDVRDVPFEQARQDALAEGEQTAQDRTVAERSAVRLQGVLTEEVLLPAGTRVTTWLVELDTGTLLLTTDDAGEDDYEAAVVVLDAMAESLEIP
jgi:hypothetical protein